VRSVLLEDAASAAKLAPLLPPSLGQTATTGTGFPALLAILRNPGMRPYLEPGIPRVASYKGFSEYRDNWWDGQWQSGNFGDAPAPALPAPAAFLTREQVAAGATEYKRLMELRNAPVTLGSRVMDYAKAHPDDKNVPEALALTVRVTHYATSNWKDQEKNTADNHAMSKAAFQLLHSRYPQSDWAKKTKFFY
jgi:hypothetical protein